MYEGNIETNWFVYDSNNAKITVFEKGDLDPVAIIPVDPNLSEKECHYEIMEWALRHRTT